MLSHSWSIALLICCFTSLFLICLAVKTAVKILLYWDSSSDSEKQINLESETWLAALSMEFGIVLQLVSFLLLLIAADSFSEVLAGAMCATGAFLANDYGIPALFIKMAGIFLYGFWLVLHRLDIQSEQLLLTRIKFVYLLFLLPFLLADFFFLTQYLINLEPDIVTSCCGVIFSDSSGDGRNLLGPLSSDALLWTYYLLAGSLIVCGCFLRFQNQETGVHLAGTAGTETAQTKFLQSCYSFGWLIFFMLSLVVITVFISSYIYKMPSHRCPFDILKKEYHYVGWPIYTALFTGAFFAISIMIVLVIEKKEGLQELVQNYKRKSVNISLTMLLIFLIITTWFPLNYIFFVVENNS